MVRRAHRQAPNVGWLREVDFHLGRLALADGDKVKAQDYLRQSGYKSFDKPIVLTTPFSEDTLSGHAFASRRIAEIIPGRVYGLSVSSSRNTISSFPTIGES